MSLTGKNYLTEGAKPRPTTPRPSQFPKSSLVEGINRFYSWKKGNQIMIFHEKHVDRYFKVFAEEDVGRACLVEVKNREEECPFRDLLDEPDKPEVVDPKKIAKLPESFRKQAEEKLASYKKERQRYEDDLRIAELSEKAVKDGDVLAAMEVIRVCQDHEYCGYEFRDLE